MENGASQTAHMGKRRVVRTLQVRERRRDGRMCAKNLIFVPLTVLACQDRVFLGLEATNHAFFAHSRAAPHR
jgi:hypothetical protein